MPSQLQEVVDRTVAKLYTHTADYSKTTGGPMIGPKYGGNLMRTNKSLWLMLLLLGVVVFAAPGCIFSPDDSHDGGGGGGPDYPAPLTPLVMMDNFNTAYSEMDIAGYRGLLDDRFLFFFNSGGEFWTKEEDLISMDNLFSGEARTNSDGIATKAISEIAVDLLLIREAWEPISASHPHFGDIAGVQKSLYQVRFVLYHSGGTITVESNQTFYAVPKTVDGVTKWYLIGQQDEA